MFIRRSLYAWHRLLELVMMFVVTLSLTLPRAQCESLDNKTVIDESFFPVLCWDIQGGWKNQRPQIQQALQDIRDCHFTVAGFAHAKDVAWYEKFGLKVLVFGDSDDVTFDEWSVMWKKANLTDAQIDQKIRDMVHRTPDSPAVLGYFICDEPGASSFGRLAKAVECVKKYAPGKLAYINLYPDYALKDPGNKAALDITPFETASYAEYLERFVSLVKPQFLSYDNYIVQHSMDLSTKWRGESSYYANLLAVRETALKHGLPFWNIVSSNQLRSHTPIPSPANLSFQAYTTLAAGGRGVSWFTYYALRSQDYAPIDDHGRKTPSWYFLREINRQLTVLGPVMNRLISTGVYFTAPAPLASLPILPGKRVRSVTSEVPMMIGEFADAAGDPFVMVVNLSLEKSATFKIELTQKKETIHILSAASVDPIPLDTGTEYWLVAGQGVLLKL